MPVDRTPSAPFSCGELKAIAAALGGTVGRVSGEGDVILLSPDVARRLQASCHGDEQREGYVAVVRREERVAAALAPELGLVLDGDGDRLRHLAAVAIDAVGDEPATDVDYELLADAQEAGEIGVRPTPARGLPPRVCL